jgi:hypothetical protein
MINEKPPRRMTLRQLLTHSEKFTRDLIEHTQTSLLNHLTDFRDLSRPVRRRSHYPTLVAVHNSLRKVSQSWEETMSMTAQLQEQLEEIRAHAQRERASRL